MKKVRWTIEHEDDHIIIVDKPAHFLSTPDRYNKDIANLVTSLKLNRDDIFVTQRIDKETSGLILFSKTADSHKKMSLLFENHDINKHFKTITLSQPPLEIGQIELPLSKHHNPRKGMIVNPEGKEAITKYRILEAFKRYAFLEIKLVTAHVHQIRAHMKAMHCPVVCDTIYGDGKPFFLSDVKRKFRRAGEEKPLLSRVAIHSSKLNFEHPLTKELIEVESELPKDMKATLNQLRKND